MSTVRTAWALSGNKAVHIREVNNGKLCNCICPTCKTPLIANQGEIKSWYFSHSTKVDCSGESAIHLAAKEILAKAANDQDKLSLPGHFGSVAERDISGREHRKSWDTRCKLVSIDNAESEYKIGTQIIDSKVEHNGNILLIEICVTHKKSDEDVAKFQSSAIDAIEIDLGDLDWQIGRKDLEQAVLHDCTRKWLCSTELSAIKSRHQLLLKQLITEKNKIHYEDLECDALSLDDELHRLDWPVLEKYHETTGSFNQRLFVAEKQTVKIIRFDSRIEKHGNSFKRVGYIFRGENRPEQQISVYFVIDDSRTTINDSGAYLLMRYDARILGGDFRDKFELSWHNIQLWEKRLTHTVRKKLANLKRVDTEKYLPLKVIEERFTISTPAQKLELIYSAIGITPPSNPVLTISDRWNTGEDIWKGLTFLSAISFYPSGTIEMRQLANNSWLTKILHFATDNIATTRRANDIFSFFSELSKIGFVERGAGSNFVIRYNVADVYV